MGEAKRRQAAKLLPSAAPPPSASAALLLSGKQYHAQHQAMAALSQYELALSLDPQDIEALRLCALALVELGRPALAEQRLQQALSSAEAPHPTLAPDHQQLAKLLADIHCQLARVQILGARVDEALGSFDAALRCKPEHGPSLYQRAATLESLGEVAAAAAGFMAAAAAQPTRALAHLGAARQLYLLDRLPQALEHQQRAFALEAHLRVDGVMGYARAETGKNNGQIASEAILNQIDYQYSAALCRAASGFDVAELVAERELLIFDDFLPDPRAWRAYALSQKFTPAGQHVAGNFPGIQTTGGFSDQATQQRIANAMGRSIKWSWPSHGAFRLSPANAKARSDIHADQDQSRPAYAGVLYLSLPEHCQGGTSFWRHRETGWSKVPNAQQAAASRFGSYANFMRLRSCVEGPDQDFGALTHAREEWELMLEVPMRFNRLILYRSDYFHAISQLFGQLPSDARLVQLFFYEPIGECSA